jgi:hypothetical protein
MDDVLGEVDVIAFEGEHLPRADCRLADREDRALDDQAVVVDAAGARALAQSRVLLVGDDLEVGSLDPPLAFAGAEAGEGVAVDQLAVERVVEELADGLLDVGAAGERPGHRLVTSEAVERAVAELAHEGAKRFLHAPHGGCLAPGFLLRPLVLGPGHRHPTVGADHSAGELKHRRDPPPTGVVDLSA